MGFCFPFGKIVLRQFIIFDQIIELLPNTTFKCIVALTQYTRTQKLIRKVNLINQVIKICERDYLERQFRDGKSVRNEQPGSHVFIDVEPIKQLALVHA